MNGVRTLYWYLDELTRYLCEQESMSMAGQRTSAHTNGVRTLRKKVDQATRVLALQDYVRQSTNSER